MKLGQKTVNLIFKAKKKFSLLFLPILDLFYVIFNISYTPRQRNTTSRLNRWVISLSIKHIYGPIKIECKKDELIVLCLVRNGEMLIESFIKYYSKLGAKHIVFLDNNSSDNTINKLKRFPNITIFQSKLPYRTYAWIFKPYLIHRFSRRNWCLCADIDEYFDYPYSDQIKLNSFLDYLNRKSYNCVIAQMLDMFSDKGISFPKNGEEFNPNIYKYYDIYNIQKEEISRNNVISNTKIKFHKGGIRAKVFDINSLYLTKFPLIILKDGLSADDFRTHQIIKNAKFADISCVLYHYKLTSDLFDLSSRSLLEKNYVHDSSDYKKYMAVIRKNPDINIKEQTKKAKKIKTINELIENNFICVSGDYISRINSIKKPEHQSKKII